MNFIMPACETNLIRMYLRDEQAAQSDLGLAAEQLGSHSDHRLPLKISFGKNQATLVWVGLQ